MPLPSIVQTVSGSGTSTSSISLSSWTPASNDLILVWVAVRQTVQATGVSGNGITFNRVFQHNDQQNQVNLSLWRGMSASPSSGQIIVTLASSAAAVIAQAHRISGAPTTGTNGSDAIAAYASADTGVTDNTSPSVNITTSISNSLIIGGCTHRNRTFTVGSGETAISINNAVGSGGDTTSISTTRRDATSPGTFAIDGSLDSANDWIMGAVAIAPGGTAHTFEASAEAASATSTADMPVARALTGQAATGGQTPAAAIAVTRVLAGQAGAEGLTPTTAIGIARSLAGQAQVQSTTPDVELLVANFVLFAGQAATGGQTPAAKVVVARVLAGQAEAASATSTADMPVARALTGQAATGGQTPAAAIAVTRVLAGQAGAEGLTPEESTLLIVLLLAGQAEAQSTASAAAVAVARVLAGQAEAQSITPNIQFLPILLPLRLHILFVPESIRSFDVGAQPYTLDVPAQQRVFNA